MTTYTWMPIGSTADLARLEDHVSAEYQPKRVAKKLIDGISGAVRAVLLEHNYVDKDYRSTYYKFYAKKGQRYKPDCVRLHFFDQTVSFDENSHRLTAADGRLVDHYFGYMVLRPTGIATIGRSVVSPDVRSGASQFIVDADHKVHLLGYRLTIQGFPWMDQHVDISVCAHVACWSILRHYSERYSLYREFLTHDITRMAQQFDPGGLIPSRGLQVSHAERVFQEAGTFPVHVARRQTSDESFYRQLLAYVESAFPLFAAIPRLRPNQPQATPTGVQQPTPSTPIGQRRPPEPGHAVAVVGYSWRDPTSKSDSGLRHAWDEVQSLAVVDDGHLPYLGVPKTGRDPYSVEDIDAFIVALPEKVFYPADAVDRLAEVLFKVGAPVDLPAKEDTILRYFITTGSAFRQFVREHESEFAPELLKTIMVLPFAQFVWVVEFATHDQWAANRVAARAVIDATASLREICPLWLFHGLTDALVFDRTEAPNSRPPPLGGLTYKSPGSSGFTRMNQNLRRTQKK